MVSGNLMERREIIWCSGHSGTRALGCDTLHKQENIGGTVCATGVCFGGFRLDSLRGRLESDGWICGKVKVPPVSELHSRNTATLLPQHVGKNQHLGLCLTALVFPWIDTSPFLTDPSGLLQPGGLPTPVPHGAGIGYSFPRL